MNIYRHFVQFYECDMMGVVHHGNYLRFYEEARVAWAHANGILDYQKPEMASQLAVVETWVRHLRPAKFSDLLEIHTQAKLEGIRITFEYKMHCPSRGNELISVARTVHAPLNRELQLVRPPIHMREIFKQLAEKKTWIETWLSNL